MLTRRNAVTSLVAMLWSSCLVVVTVLGHPSTSGGELDWQHRVYHTAEAFVVSSVTRSTQKTHHQHAWSDFSQEGDGRTVYVKAGAASYKAAMSVNHRTGHLTLDVQGVNVLSMQLLRPGLHSGTLVFECFVCEYVMSPAASESSASLVTPLYHYSMGDADRTATSTHHATVNSRWPPELLFHSRRVSVGVAFQPLQSSMAVAEMRVAKLGTTRWRVELDVASTALEGPVLPYELLIMPGPSPQDVAKQYVVSTGGARWPLELWSWDPLVALLPAKRFFVTSRHDEAIEVSDLLLLPSSEQARLYDNATDSGRRVEQLFDEPRDYVSEVLDRFDADLQRYRSGDGRRSSMHEDQGTSLSPRAISLRPTLTFFDAPRRARSGVVTTSTRQVGSQSTYHFLVPLRVDDVASRESKLFEAFLAARESAKANAILAFHRPAEAATIRFNLANQTQWTLHSITGAGSAPNTAQWWNGLSLVVPQLLSASVFGTNTLGMDPTGSAGDPPCDVELLTRLFQLTSLLPLARYPASCVDLERKLRAPSPTVSTFEFLLQDHNNAPVPEGELPPYSGMLAVRVALRLRQRLLPYLYSEAVQAHLKGSTLLRPLFAEWTTHPLWPSRVQSFLLGGGLIVRPITEHNPIRVLLSTPDAAERWYDWFTGIETTSNVIESMVDVDYGAGVPMVIRGGRVLALNVARKTHSSATVGDPLQLVVSLDVHNESHGIIYTDDGTAGAALHETGHYVFTEVHMEHSVLTFKALRQCPETQVPHMLTGCIARDPQWTARRPITKISINGLGKARLGRLTAASLRVLAPGVAPKRLTIAYRIVNKATLKLDRLPIVLDGTTEYAVELEYRKSSRSA